METTLTLLIVALFVSGSKGWSYDEQNEWDAEYPACGGKRQSPIEINVFKTKLRAYSPFVFTNFDIPHPVAITNNGHSVELKFSEPAAKMPRLAGGPIENDEIYQLENIHFHWGSNDSVGSEHVINQKRFPMEMHAVFFNTKYGNFAAATQHADGITVVAAFFHLNGVLKNSGIQRIADVLPNLVAVGSSSQIDNLKLSFLTNAMETLGKQSFVTYKGSLTTPPCLEVVTWVLNVKPIPITSSQMQRFRKLKLSPGNTPGNNWRNLQDNFGRKAVFGVSRLI